MLEVLIKKDQKNMNLKQAVWAKKFMLMAFL
jgi:hypothetical protein